MTRCCSASASSQVAVQVKVLGPGACSILECGGLGWTASCKAGRVLHTHLPGIQLCSQLRCRHVLYDGV